MRVTARTPVRAVFLAAALVATSGCSDEATTPSTSSGLSVNADTTGMTLPDVELLATTGDAVAVSSLLGQPLLVNFWYSTCEPCRREMPALAEAHREFGDRVTFIGINMSDPAVVAQNFADRYGVTFPILLDNGSALTLGLGMSIAPTTLFVNSEGVIIEQVSGELTAEDLTVRLNTLVSS